MNNKLTLGGLVVAIVLSVLAFTGAGDKLGAVLSSEQTFAGGLFTSYVKYPVAKTLTAATNTLTANDLTKGDFWKVDTTSNAVVVNFPTISTAEIGRRVRFVVTAGGSNALNMDQMASSSTNVVTMAVNSTNTSMEDVGDYADCTFVSTTKAVCTYNAKD